MTTASIVTFHTDIAELQRLIKCVANSPVDILYIVDNSSQDYIKAAVSNSQSIVYIPSENVGYGSGHNKAIREALKQGSKYHVILNPDVYWEGDIIGSLTKFMENTPECGLVMPKIIYPDGSTQYLCKLLPSPMDLIGRRFIPLNSYRDSHDFKYEMHWTGYDSIMEIPSLSGCFMFIRTEVIKKIGMFDERYFMYAEDMDLCRRIGTISKTIFYPNVEVVHEYEKGSYKNKTLLKYHINSVIKYFNKWGWLFDSYRRRKNRDCIAAIKNKNQK